MDFDGHFNRSGGRVSMVAVDIGFDGINYINYIVDIGWQGVAL